MKRVDLVLKLQRVLEAKKIHGKYDGASCIYWSIKNYDISKDDLNIEGEVVEEAKQITYES